MEQQFFISDPETVNVESVLVRPDAQAEWAALTQRGVVVTGARPVLLEVYRAARHKKRMRDYARGGRSVSDMDQEFPVLSYTVNKDGEQIPDTR